MSCESHVTIGISFLKAKHHMGPESPTLEVYVAGSFSGAPLILSRTLQLSFRGRKMREGMLNSIPEDDVNGSLNGAHSGLPLQLSEYSVHKPEDDDYNQLYSETEYFEGEDEELSWFNAGVRVGVGIGLSICLGVGIGVGLLVRTYQGTTSKAATVAVSSHCHHNINLCSRTRTPEANTFSIGYNVCQQVSNLLVAAADGFNFQHQ